MKRVSLSIPKQLHDFLLEEGRRNHESVQKTILRSVKLHADSKFYFISDPDEDIDEECIVDGDFIQII